MLNRLDKRTQHPLEDALMQQRCQPHLCLVDFSFDAA